MNTDSNQLSFPVSNLLCDSHDIKKEKDIAEERISEEPVAAELMEAEQDGSSCRVSPINQPSSSMHAALSTRDLWERFDELNTEMIVTRRGRRMFPPIKVQLQDLNPSSFYVLLMDLVPVDKYRYKYQNSQWVKCFEESCSPTRLYVHPESPALGSYWMEHNVSFYKLKLTNNQLDKQGHIIVNSMHRYQPRLHIVESSDIHNLNWEDFHTFEFPKTKFITVTAYQNDKITQLKIEYNPFAKGFRSPLARTRMKPIKTNSETEKRANDSSCISIPRIRSSSDTGSEGHSPVILQRNGVIFTPAKKRGPSISDDELPLNKKPFIMYSDAESPDALLAPYRNSSSFTVGISPPPPPLLSIPKDGLIYEPVISNNKSDPQYLTSRKVIEPPKGVHLVEVSPSGRNSGVSVISPSPTGGLCKSARSSCSEETDDSDSDTSSTGGSSSRSTSTGSKLTTMLSAQEFYRTKKNMEPKKPSVINNNRQFVPVGGHQSPSVTAAAQFLQHSALQPLITYPAPSQPLYIQPSLDGRSQQILVPIATVPLSTSSNSPSNKIQSNCGVTPQGLYLQTSPTLVQGTNSSQTLQLATVPASFDATATHSKPQQQLLHSAGAAPPSGTVPIYINGHSAQILPQSSQPIQIVTLANATHVHS